MRLKTDSRGLPLLLPDQGQGQNSIANTKNCTGPDGPRSRGLPSVSCIKRAELTSLVTAVPGGERERFMVIIPFISLLLMNFHTTQRVYLLYDLEMVYLFRHTFASARRLVECNHQEQKSEIFFYRPSAPVSNVVLISCLAFRSSVPFHDS
ncbi:hypothetical protein BJV78DRAFT_86530 [Lactifluus subvellereus]|nr:hypothetical protein BJV78DRAFT_86530 [Lactifluus subvellereus]